MNMKRREKWSCGRKNRKYRGENRRHLNNRVKASKENRFSYHKNMSKSTRNLIWHNEVRGAIEEFEAERMEAELELMGWFFYEDEGDVPVVEMTRFEALCAVDPEYAMKVKDKTFAKACDSGAVNVDRWGNPHCNLLPSSVCRKRHKDRVRRREEALKQIAS